MHAIYRLYVWLGRLLFWALLPVEKVMLRRTSRVYAAIIKDQQVLLVKNWLSDGKWAFPGGGIKKTESNVESLQRELKEELGIVLASSPLKPIANGKWQGHKFLFSYAVYAPKIVEGFKINRKLEITEAAWVNIASLNINNTATDVLDILRRKD